MTSQMQVVEGLASKSPSPVRESTPRRQRVASIAQVSPTVQAECDALRATVAAMASQIKIVEDLAKKHPSPKPDPMQVRNDRIAARAQEIKEKKIAEFKAKQAKIEEEKKRKEIEKQIELETQRLVMKADPRYALRANVDSMTKQIKACTLLSETPKQSERSLTVCTPQVHAKE